MCADKSEAEHKETAARNKILEDKLVGLEGVMEGACPARNPKFNLTLSHMSPQLPACILMLCGK